jgi:glycosyltransferase involved in cell wall biosynthesis
MTNSIPAVSVVTPSFNQGKFIQETIESVLSQEGDFTLEYRILDAGSSDQTVGIIEKYSNLVKENRYPVRCRGISFAWKSETDRGQADAINKGFKLATGDILAWLNSDDTYAPGSLQKAVRSFAQNPEIKYIYGDCYFTDEEMGQKKYFNLSSGIRLKQFVRGEGRGLIQPTVFVRREAVSEVGLLNEALYFTLDQDWFIRIARRFKGRYVPFPFAYDRLHARAKTYDRLQPDYLAEVLLLNGKYGGLRRLAKNFGRSVHELVKRDGMAVEDVCRQLRLAMERKSRILGFDIPGKIYEQGVAYSLLYEALEMGSKARGRSASALAYAIGHAPCLLLSSETIWAFVKWMIPVRWYERYVLIKKRKREALFPTAG